MAGPLADLENSLLPSRESLFQWRGSVSPCRESRSQRRDSPEQPRE